MSAARKRLESMCGQLGVGVGVGIKVNDTCGIIATVGAKEDCAEYLLEGLGILENRGYDSAGMTTCDAATGALVTSKFASAGTTSDALQQLRAEDVQARHKGHSVGIAHTRWATHGGKTDTNAHPHSDAKGRVAIVHNGVIQNYDELRREVESHGVRMRSETDSEVIAQLIGVYLDAGLDVVAAARRVHERLRGTWGVVAVAQGLPGKVIAMKNGSPLLIGLADGRAFVASEPGAFARHTRRFVALHDGEFAVIGCGGCAGLDVSRVQVHEGAAAALSPAPWPHWTIREIMEQPVALSMALNCGGRILSDREVKLGGLEAKRADLLAVRHLLIAACGTSAFAGQYGAGLMRSLGCFDTVQVVDAAEVTAEAMPRPSRSGNGDCCCGGGGSGGVLAISQSGETKDVHRAVLLARELGLPVFSVVNAVGSLIARTTGCGLYLNAGREAAVASTKAFTSQVCCLALVAVWFAQQREQSGTGRPAKQADLVAALQRLPTSVGVALGTRAHCRDIAARIIAATIAAAPSSGSNCAKKGPRNRSMFVLGKGLAEPVAREGALKIKEITYVHAEGYGGGALKHGPFALIEEGTPIILIIPDDDQAAFMGIAAAEVMSRGAYTVVITDNRRIAKHAHDVIEVPTCGPLSALVAIIPIQLIAYEMSVLRGINPDKPRNLAKAVTVD